MPQLFSHRLQQLLEPAQKSKSANSMFRASLKCWVNWDRKLVITASSAHTEPQMKEVLPHLSPFPCHEKDFLISQAQQNKDVGLSAPKTSSRLSAAMLGFDILGSSWQGPFLCSWEGSLSHQLNQPCHFVPEEFDGIRKALNPLLQLQNPQHMDFSLHLSFE